MTKARLCILSLAPLQHDARVLRQINHASHRYRVTVVGWGPLDRDRAGVTLLPVERHEFALPQRLMQTALMAAGRLRADLFDRWYWRKPDHREALRCVVQSRPQLIHANEAIALPIALQAAEATGAAVLFDAHEYSLDQWKGNARLRWLAGPLHRHLVSKYAPCADAMITVAPGIAERYAARLGMACGVVRNVPDYAPTPFRPTHADGVKLVHHGAAIRGRGIDRLIRALARLPNRFSLQLMLMPGTPGAIESLQRLAREIAPDRVTFADPVPTAQVVSTIAGFDVGVFLLPPGDVSYELALPNKFFDFIMAGLAVAIGPSPEMARIVLQESCGVVADGFEAHDLVASLESLTGEQIDAMKRASLAAAKTYSAGTEMAKLGEIYGRLIDAVHAGTISGGPERGSA